MIKVTNLHKYFNKGRQNEIHVINNTSIEFPETGLVAITGPSGCGKTTLLNIIGGLDKFAKGQIDFDGTIINRYKALEWDVLRNKSVGYIFQNYNLLTDKTVYENVEISLNMAGLYEKDKVEERINYVLESVGMYNYRRRNVQALSGGQQQRVAIARAIAKSPKVVLADEPTGNLDVNNTFEIMSIIKKISQTCLVILVSHEKDLVDFYADRVIEIKDGVIVNDYENSGNRTLEHVDTRNIYLLDMEKATSESPIPVEFYYEKESASKPNIKVISLNNTVYIKADSKAKIKYITDDSEIKLLNMHYRKPETSDVTEHVFDLHQFGHITSDKIRKSFIRFKDTLKAGFAKLFRKRKFGSRMFLIAYIVISALIVYNLATFTNLTGIQDKDFLNIARGMVAVEITTDITPAAIYSILEETDVTSVNYYSARQSFYYDYGNFYQADKQSYWSSYSTRSTGYPVKLSQVDDPQLILGRLPVNNREVVIDKWIADDLLESASVINMGGTSYLDILEITISPTTYPVDLQIVGIVETDSPIMILTDDNFNLFYSNYYLMNGYVAQGSAADYYAISLGRDISTAGEILISDDNTILNIGNSIVRYGVELTVVGKYTSDTITGTIVLNDDFETMVIYAYTSDFDYYYSSGYVYFTTDDIEQSIQEIATLDYIATDAYQTARDHQVDNVQSQIASKLRIILISLAGSIVYLVFMMRSSLLGRVKEVGIYRSIGATRADVAKIFVSEILSFTTIGSLTGYLAMSFLIVEFQKLNPLATEEFYFPFYIFLAGIIAIYILNIIFGMIPVFTLLRKTPSEINAKYDV